MLAINKRVAKLLLETGCVSLRPEDPFTYASGLKGPIYCDNRRVLSHPEARLAIVDSFIEYIDKNHFEFDAVAGLATGGIPHAAFIAQKLAIPMLYVRSKAKDYGKQSLVEGDTEGLKKILLIEDLINQGSSLDKVITPVKNDGLQVAEVLSVVSYQMKKADEISKKNNVAFHALTNFDGLVEVGIELNLIKADQKEMLLEWQEDPKAWGEKYGK